MCIGGDVVLPGRVWIGIDPGKSGAIAFIPEDEAPSAIKNKETLHDLVEALENAKASYCDNMFAVIEKVHSMPGQGVASSFKFGESYGQLTALLVALGIPYETVSPQRWQKELQCLTKGDKNITKAKAQALFPQMKITHAIADALLIATYCKRNF